MPPTGEKISRAFKNMLCPRQLRADNGMMGELSGKRIQADRIVVVMPNWLGDGVMATPFLRGLRSLYPKARIAAAARPLVGPVCAGLVDEVKIFDKGQEAATARWMRQGHFELGVLLPNSFRSAWMMWRGGVKRRLGYARGGRSLLLTDRVKPIKKTTEQWWHDEAIRLAIRLLRQEEPIADGELVRVDVTGKSGPYVEHRMLSSGKVVRSRLGALRDNDLPAILRANFQAVPTIDYYLELVRYLNGDAEFVPDNAARRMELSISEDERREAEKALQTLGFADAVENQKSKIKNLAVIVPGANFGASKCWLPERFAAVAEQLADPAGPFGAKVLLAGSPAEKPICDAILAAVSRQKDTVAALGDMNGGMGVSIGALKEIVRQAKIMICNDTGPRHMAVAFGVPVVTLFGPTDPVWAETFFEKERIVRVNVPCGPCQLKVCPIDHRCMKGITVEMVMKAVGELWNRE